MQTGIRERDGIAVERPWEQSRVRRRIKEMVIRRKEKVMTAAR